MIRALAESARETFRIKCRFKILGKMPELPADTTQQLYKIAQESVSNAIKHGKAKLVLVTLAYDHQQVTLRIKNDGEPFPEQIEPNKRMGLRIMNYRAGMLKGSFTIEPNADCGSLVTCTIPFVNGAEKENLSAAAKRSNGAVERKRAAIHA